MGEEVRYKLLNKVGQIIRCDELMINKMQCPTRAAVELLNVKAPPDSARYLCMYHLNQHIADDGRTGISYKEEAN